MERRLTGEAADAYVSAWMESAAGRKPLNAIRVRSDALAARSSRKALTRLRLASARVAVTRHAGVGASVCRARRFVAAPRSRGRRAACARAGSPERPRLTAGA